MIANDHLQKLGVQQSTSKEPQSVTGVFRLLSLRFLMSTAQTTVGRQTVCVEIGSEKLHTVLQNSIFLFILSFVLRQLILIDFVKLIPI